MVAVIKTSRSVKNTLLYNEKKVKKGKALCIGVSGYPKDLEELSFDNKLNRFLHQASLNVQVKVPCMHISLNFDPSENLSAEKLNAITDDYLVGIGFGGQPYLVYRHLDTLHPHIHIVTIKIREDGTRIETNYLGKNESEHTRKALEIKYGLISPKKKERTAQKIVQVDKVIYGKVSTVAAIENVVDVVLENYKYANLQEFNAVLRLYNVMAHQGAENSLIRKKGGLIYRLLDQSGNAVGRPVRASDLYNKPIMKLLRNRFTLSNKKPAKDRKRLISMINLFFSGGSQNFGSIVDALNGMKISITFPKTAEGDEVYYIDHNSKCVFSSNDLGIEYGRMRIMERFQL